MRANLSAVMRPLLKRSETVVLPTIRQQKLDGARTTPDRPIIKVRLYVAGDAPNSALARINLYAMFKTQVCEDYEIEVVDLLQAPERGILDQIRMTPTLLKLTPGPVKRIVGTLSESERVLQALGLSDRIP